MCEGDQWGGRDGEFHILLADLKEEVRRPIYDDRVLCGTRHWVCLENVGAAKSRTHWVG